MMKGVLLKDLYIAKSNIFVTIVSLIVLGFGLSFLLGISALLILAPVASTTAVFISITSDAGSKWNKNVITMPVSRNQIIREKFIFYILLAVIGLITALIPCIVLMLAGADITVHSLCLYAAIGMSATLLAGGISLPCAYLFDPEKSQIVFMMSFMVSTGVIVGLVLLTNLFIPVKDNIICPNMKMTSLEDVLQVLENENNEINVDAEIAKKAVKCIDRMLEASK